MKTYKVILTTKECDTVLQLLRNHGLCECTREVIDGIYGKIIKAPKVKE